MSGLHRFGEVLGGAPFNLLIFRNLLETAEPLWLLEVFYLYSRLSQLFSIGRTSNVANIMAPTHP